MWHSENFGIEIYHIRFASSVCKGDRAPQRTICLSCTSAGTQLRILMSIHYQPRVALVFERRRLLVEASLAPGSVQKRLKRMARIQELEALLDYLTGGRSDGLSGSVGVDISTGAGRAKGDASD